MKKRYTTLLFFLFCGLAIHSQSFKNASDYLDFVGEEHQNITKNMWKYTKAVAHSKSDRTIDAKRNVLVKSVERAIAKIEKAQGYGGDDFKNHVLTHMRLNESMLKHDYANIIDLKEVAEQSYDYMEAYVLAQELADKKMEEAYKEYDTHFRVFAAKHNINIIENESDLGNKMKISNEVFKHYNKLHLMHFKVSINEVYLLDAFKRNDMSAIQQNANALSETAKEGLKLLNTLDVYKNDKTIVEATKQAFEFYIEEAEVQVPKLIEFLALNETFENIKNTLGKTPQNKRTKEQIDSYNAKVSEINKAVNIYNKVNTDLNNKRQKVVEKLNTVNANFLSKHIPND